MKVFASESVDNGKGTEKSIDKIILLYYHMP